MIGLAWQWDAAVTAVERMHAMSRAGTVRLADVAEVRVDLKFIGDRSSILGIILA